MISSPIYYTSFRFFPAEGEYSEAVVTSAQAYLKVVGAESKDYRAVQGSENELIVWSPAYGLDFEKVCETFKKWLRVPFTYERWTACEITEDFDSWISALPSIPTT